MYTYIHITSYQDIRCHMRSLGGDETFAIITFEDLEVCDYTNNCVILPDRALQM